MERRTDDSFLGFTRQYWPIIVSLFGLAVSVGVIKTRVDSHEVAICENRIEHRNIGDRMARVEQNQILMAEQIPEIRNDIKQILREIRK